MYICSLLITTCPKIDQDGWRYVHMVTIRNTPLSTKDDEIQAIGAKGVAGSYEFEPFSAIS